MEILENGDSEQLKKIRIKIQVLLEKIGEYLTKEIEGLELMYAVVFDDRSNRVRMESSAGTLVVINEKIVRDIILTAVLPLFDLNERKSSANSEDAIFLEGGGSITISVFNKPPYLPCQVLVSANLYSYD